MGRMTLIKTRSMGWMTLIKEMDDSRELIGKGASEENALVHEQGVQDAPLRRHLDAPVQNLWLAIAGCPEGGHCIRPQPAFASRKRQSARQPEERRLLRLLLILAPDCSALT